MPAEEAAAAQAEKRAAEDRKHLELAEKLLVLLLAADHPLKVRRMAYDWLATHASREDGRL